MSDIKQNISSQQLEELSDKQIKALFDYWWDKRGIGKNELTSSEKIPFGYSSLYELPLMSIGDMIEFLGDKGVWLHICQSCEGYFHVTNNYNDESYYREELSDGLWELTKEYLNK